MSLAIGCIAMLGILFFKVTFFTPVFHFNARLIMEEFLRDTTIFFVVGFFFVNVEGRNMNACILVCDTVSI